MMAVELINDGPVTLMVETREGDGHPVQARSAGLLEARLPAAGTDRLALSRHLLPLDTPLVLASASPRRTEILAQAGIHHVVSTASTDESSPPGESPVQAAESIARRKAMAVASNWKGCWILAADTIVDCAGESFGKPLNDDDARSMLARLSGRAHQVHTGLALVSPGGMIHSAVESTRVTFRELSPVEIEHYV
ncbi:MAG: septum formation protein, partial [bacterium]